MVGGSISSAYLVALGNNRNNGRSLGLFTVNANNALNNANANNWRPRLSTRTRENISVKASKYFLYFDIKKFYEHIRHEDAIEAVRRIIKDEACIRLVAAIINATPKGLPIGFTGSHYFANLLLVPLYHLIMGIKNVSECYHTPQLYPKLFRRTCKGMVKFITTHDKHVARGLISRFGWLKLVGRENILSDVVPLDYVKGKAK